MNGYEFVNDVIRPLRKDKLIMLCFGFIRAYLNSIRFNDIAKVVLQYAEEGTIFAIFNKKFCSIAHESNEANNLFHCVFKRKNPKEANTLVMLVPFLSQIIKNYSNSDSINSTQVLLLKTRC